MTRYLAADTLHETVERLGSSGANPTLTDWLVFKRALVNTQKTSPKAVAVATGLESRPFQDAIIEVAGCAQAGNALGWTGQPFFSPFGFARDKQHGFKGPKYPSNGPSDTVAGWQSRSTPPLQLVPSSKPKQYKFEARTGPELRAFFLKKDDSPPPSLIDAARWWFRGRDVQSAAGQDPTCKQLCDAFIKELALQPSEVAALFEQLSPQDAPLPAGNFDANLAVPANYLPASIAPTPKAAASTGSVSATAPADLEGRIDQIAKFIEARGYIFDPWQVAAFVTAVRTKPFVILAGISGTGKTKLPRLIAEATGSECDVIPVHPDWTDGSDLVGYERLDGTFVPGRLLRVARRAMENPTKQFFVVLDEMNIARVEYYLADVLSHIEERERHGTTLQSKPLVPHVADGSWNAVCLPSNLCIVGSVNMDETTHGFSRKVLDRSFVIEFSDVDLGRIADMSPVPPPIAWTAEDWSQRYLKLAEHPDRAGALVEDVIEVLETINDALSRAQLQVGYRVRDEIALFRLNARECEASFRTADAGTIDPLDLAVAMKILPRIQGGGTAIQDVLDRLRAWTSPKAVTDPTNTSSSPPRAFPRCQERIELMHVRLRGGFTSYWL